jgi:hypothetical protein
MIMKAARTSETSVNLHQTTRRYNTEDSHLHSRHENLKYDLLYSITTRMVETQPSCSKTTALDVEETASVPYTLNQII